MYYFHLTEKCPMIQHGTSLVINPSIFFFVMKNSKEGKEKLKIFYPRIQVCRFCKKFYFKGSTFIWGGTKEKWFDFEPEDLL